MRRLSEVKGGVEGFIYGWVSRVVGFPFADNQFSHNSILNGRSSATLLGVV